jgi:hypothetical protein
VFLKNKPTLSIRKPEATSLNRITAFTKLEVDRFFSNLLEIVNKHNFTPDRIFNIDETGITTVHKPRPIIAPKGQKQVGVATSWERRKTMIVCCAMSASGTYVPPLFTYARMRMAESLKRGGPTGSIYDCSKNGWITDEVFLIYIKHFAAFTKASQANPV